MKIDAKVQSISKLKDYFFLVPDYQREYVWKPDDEVEQFLIDIENEYSPDAKEQRNYFLGSIIIANNDRCFDVVDGQQRLTTIMLSLCVFRDLLKKETLNSAQKNYLQIIENLLYNFDIESGETRVRLELQYEESHDYLTALIQEQPYNGVRSPSIVRMQDAYTKILRHFQLYAGIDELIDFAKYCLTKIELVVIESQDLSSALKIFETINQRGAGLNAMDLVKNLLFSHQMIDPLSCKHFIRMIYKNWFIQILREHGSAFFQVFFKNRCQVLYDWHMPYFISLSMYSYMLWRTH